MPEDFKAGFLKTLWIIRDYLSEIVIGCGWTHYIAVP
jgi:hypothetical protein